METVLWILAGLAIAIGLVLVIASMRPGTFVVARSAHINAPPERVVAFIDDFRQWAHWSPWEKMDPGLERKYSGAQRGVGAVYEWQGPKAGQGRMEITDVVPAARVGLDLDFMKPFKAHNTVVFAVDGDAGGSQVSWTMSGEQGLMGKVMSLFLNMDKMLGGQFDEGLAAMKRAAEAG